MEFWTKRLLFLLSFLFVSGCFQTHVRDVRVYKTELELISKIIEAQSQTISHFLTTHCECVDDEWVGFECEQAADTLSVVQSRWKWHKKIMLFNADLGENPGSLPEIKDLGCDDVSKLR